MGFASHDDLISKLTVSGNFFRTDWTKQLLAASAYTIGRWYDMTTLPGYPQQMVYGDLVTNGIIAGNANGWSLGANWAYAAPNTLTKTAGAANNASQTSMTVVGGHSYLLSYNITAISGGNLIPSVGGTAGATQTTTGVKNDVITASTTGVLQFAPASATACTITNISCVDRLYSAQLSDTMLSGAMYHGGNVIGGGSVTKHILNAGVVAPAATSVPGVWLLCDMLLAYPGIDLYSNALQTLTTTLTLPRYTDGKGVRAFLQPAPIAGVANAQNISFKYTNTVPTSGQACPVTLANTASAILGHISHSGVAANNYGPFIPLAAGDMGITKADSVQFSAAAASATWATLVLCKPLLTLPSTTASVLTERDLLNQLPSLPRVVDGACLGWLFFAGAAFAASSNVYGYLDFGWA